MKDWDTKVDNGLFDGAGHVDDMNSNYIEKKRVVKQAMELDRNDKKQLVKSIEVISKSMLYKDVGPSNKIHLVQYNNAMPIETYFDGMVILFLVNDVKDVQATIGINILPTVPVHVNGTVPPPAYFDTTNIYFAIYNGTTNAFDVSKLKNNANDSDITRGDENTILEVSSGVLPHDVINVGQLASYVNITDVLDTSESNETTKVLASNQLHQLQVGLNTLGATLNSNDSNLDTYQKIIDVIKQDSNKITNIQLNDVAGLVDSLNTKADSTHIHDDLYYEKTFVTDRLTVWLADLHGNADLYFMVANGTAPDNVINRGQLDAIHGTLWNYSETTNPLVTTNPTVLGSIWLNSTTGEIFMCKDITTDNNVWMGSNGTEVKKVTNAISVDAFGDGSAIALYELNGDLNDTGGVNNLTWKSDYRDLVFSTTAKFGSHGIYSYATRDSLITQDRGGRLIRTVSLWYRFDALSGNENYILSYYNSNTPFYLDVSNTGSNTIYLHGGDIYCDGVAGSKPVPKDDEYHHYVAMAFADDNQGFGRMHIGNKYNGDGSNDCSGGWIDQIRVFDRRLTEAEITQLYNEGN